MIYSASSQPIKNQPTSQPYSKANAILFYIEVLFSFSAMKPMRLLQLHLTKFTRHNPVTSHFHLPCLLGLFSGVAGSLHREVCLHLTKHRNSLPSSVLLVPVNHLELGIDATDQNDVLYQVENTDKMSTKRWSNKGLEPRIKEKLHRNYNIFWPF